MKKLNVLLVLVFAMIASYAQRGEQMDPKQRAQQTVSKLKEGGLALADESWTQVQTIYEGFYTQMASARSEGANDRSKMQANMEDKNTKLKALLTADQFSKLQEIEKKNMPGGGQHKRPNN